MKRVYLYKMFERFWHWAQMLLISVLLVTGFEIHSTYELLGYDVAVKWHNYSAWGFIVLIVFAIFWHFSTNAWKNYIPTSENFKAQIEFYITGIFRNAPHPTKKRVLSKLNPLQRLIYLFLKAIVIPIMVVSGLLYFYFHYPAQGIEVTTLKPIAIVHTFGAFMLIVFLIAHVYLITTGHTITSNLKAMITGWEEMDDEDAKEIIEEAIDEVGKNITQGHYATSTKKKEVKDIIVEALEDIEDKVQKEELKGQKALNKKKKNKK